MTWIDLLLDRWLVRGNVGARGERAAANYLRGAGYRILARNLRNRFGEIDILAQAPDGRALVVVEVKARALTDSPGRDIRPEIHVNGQKQRRLAALAAQVARRYKLTDRPIRFDVIGVDLPAGKGAKPVVRHHPCAFESRV
jgi:putative endonuclease